MGSSAAVGGSGGAAAGTSQTSGGGATQTSGAGATSGSGGNTSTGMAGASTTVAGASSGGAGGSGGAPQTPPPTEFDNPIIKYDAPDPTNGPGDPLFTADGAAFAWQNRVYLYTGHDEAEQDATTYRMFDWYLFVSQDMVSWENKGAVMRYDVFSWARGDTSTGNANAGEVIQRDDSNGNPKFYFYVPVEGGQTDYGISIGVAVADSPEGPFEDARGIPLIYLADTAQTATHSWRNLDPSPFVDDDGRAYMYWGNGDIYWVELEEDMIHVKGETYMTDGAGTMTSRTLPAGAIQVLPRPADYTEAPFVHKHSGVYYLSYAVGFPESIAYATSDSPTGPWQERDIILDQRANTGTVHQSIFEFQGASYITYHDASLPTGYDYRRSTCIDRLYYNDDGTIVKVVPTSQQ
jgi:hypothetical protein